MVVMFVDLRAAFDSVDRGILGKAMRMREIRRGLIRRIEEVMKKTRCRINVGGE